MRRGYHPKHLLLGFVAWSLWFTVMYGGLSVACVVAPPAANLGSRSWLNLGLVLLTVMTALGLLSMALRCWRSTRAQQQSNEHLTPFVPWVGAVVYFAAALATLAVGVPAAVLPPCV